MQYFIKNIYPDLFMVKIIIAINKNYHLCAIILLLSVHVKQMQT